ncbi:TPA: hypothetical protein PL572_003047 [Cronobacter turicensis]|nr:hypothetical protein [Cronobacter turicensis]
MKQLMMALIACCPLSVLAAAPDCASWPMNMAQVWLKNEKIVDIAQLDTAKTSKTLLAAEKKKDGIYTEVYRFIFHDKAGKSYELITKNDASAEECSVSGVSVFLVSKSEITE